MNAFLAVDWGTTNRRIYRIEAGTVTATARDDLGARALRTDQYSGEVVSIRDRFGDLPVLMAGMVGSTLGWAPASYVELPAGLHTLAASLTWMDERTAIVPGVAQRKPADVMRGEEVQLLGATAAGMVPDDALLCQPGTHCKWAELQQGSISGFSTAMTGELFGLLSGHSILAGQLGGAVADSLDFREGVRRGAEHQLQTELFQVRARSLLDQGQNSAAFVSGLLIGDDAARHLEHGLVYILADGTLGSLYAAAIAELGGRSLHVDSHAAFVAGIIRIWESIV